MLEKRIPSAAEDELPPPNAVLVILMDFAQAFLPILPKRKRREFLSRVDALMAQHAMLANITPIRPASQQADVDAERLKAAALWRRVRPRFEQIVRE